MKTSYILDHQNFVKYPTFRNRGSTVLATFIGDNEVNNAVQL